MRLARPSDRVRGRQCYTPGPVGLYRGMQHITGWQDVVDALTHRGFSHDASALRRGDYSAGFDGYWATEGEEHDKLKEITHGFLNSLEAIKLRIQAARRLTFERITLIAQREGDTFDYAQDLAYPVTIDLVWEMIGLPDELRLRLLQEVVDYERRSFGGDLQPEPPWVRQVISEQVGIRCRELKRKPCDPKDLLDVVALALNAKLITPERAVGFVWMFLAASHGTLGTLVGNEFGLISEFKYAPTVRDLTWRIDWDNLDLSDLQPLQPFSNEANRLITSFAHGPTWPQQQITLSSSAVIEPGTAILCFSAANRDFADPHIYRPDRANLGRHLGYGRGRHRCGGERLSVSASTVITGLAFRFLEDLEWDKAQGWDREEGIVDTNLCAPAVYNRSATLAGLGLA